MTRLTYYDEPLYAEGSVPAIGHLVPRCTFATVDLREVGLGHFGAWPRMLLVVPSVEWAHAGAMVQNLDRQMVRRPDAASLVIAPGLPFALARWAAGAALRRTVLLSCFRTPLFTRSLGVDIVSAALRGIAATAIFALDATHRVLHAQLLRRMDDEPDLRAALAALPVEPKRDVA